MERIVQETPACTAVQFHDETDTEIIEEVYGNHTQGVDYTLYLRRPEDDSRWRVSMHVDTSYWHQSRLSVTRWNGERWYGAFDPPRDSMKVFVHHHGPGTVYIGAKPTREALRYLAATWIVAALRVVPV